MRDPRADALKRAVRQLAERSSVLPGRLAFAEAVEEAALAILKDRKPNRSLQTNVEFYTALLLEALAFPPSAFTLRVRRRPRLWLDRPRPRTGRRAAA